MTIFHALPRVMLASYFAVSGYRAWCHPDELDRYGRPLVEEAVSAARPRVPPSLAATLADDTAGVVKAFGMVQMVGSAMLATGILRRVGAGLLAASMVPHIVASTRVPSVSTRTDLTVKNTALAGGALIAALDTQGKPSLLWRLRLHRQVERQAKQSDRRQAKAAKKLARKAAKSESGE
ncbi:MAG: DoxX family membrane protein [Propionibacteriaceae bacterium]|jgi:uncharacterized membrane protein YphA (DoxX/SURF4 family)|nr:DoxX family membrane protein [Propionibacteriaceae bacterium]